MFKCGLHLIVIEILWFNINEAPVSPFECFWRDAGLVANTSTATMNFSYREVNFILSIRAGSQCEGTSSAVAIKSRLGLLARDCRA